MLNDFLASGKGFARTEQNNLVNFIEIEIQLMKNTHPIFILFILAAGAVSAQPKTRKLPAVINHPSINVTAPYMSVDGSGLVYVSDYAQDYSLTIFYTYKDRANWSEPKPLPKSLSNLNFLYGTTLSADGKTIYVSSFKSPGAGGYDIWMSESRGSSWTAPVNLVNPINTKSNEASASFTPDGKTIYFMRCEKMNEKSASDCKIFVAKKKSNGQWGEPEEMPDFINTGNSQFPRILADGETLLFSSDKFSGNKGGLDLYETRLVNGNWTTPVALDFTNSERDDKNVSVNAIGRYLLRDAPGARKSELVEYLIPKELRPKGLTKVDGKVLDPSGAPVASYISVVEAESKKSVYNGRPEKDGSFTLYLLEGARYEVAADPEQSNYNFFVQVVDLTVEDIPQFEKINPVLKPIQIGDNLPLDAVAFEPHGVALKKESMAELDRLVRLIKSNPGYSYEIQVLLAGFEEDSIVSTSDLTEVIYDSLQTTYTEIDTLGQRYEKDTIVVKTRYHNDRTLQQGEQIVAYLTSKGIDASRTKLFGNARPEAILEKKKIKVNVLVRENGN